MTLQFVTPGGSYSDYQNTRGDPFAVANQYLIGDNGIKNFVEDQILYAQGISNTATTKAYNTIEGLEGVQLIIPDGLSPVLPPLDFTFDYDLIPLEPTLPDFGTVTPWPNLPAPNFSGDTEVSPFNIPDFNPSFTNFVIPPIPPWEDPTPLPSAPEVDDPVFGPAPVFVEPNVPQLSSITLPPTPVITIPDLDVIFPEFDALPPILSIEWTEPTYTPTIINQTIAQIEKFLAGGTGIRDDVQEAMYAAAVERENRLANQATQEIIDDYAARGFSIPPGMLQRRVDSIRTDRDLKKQGISRDILIKAMDAEIENLRFAVTEGRQAEELFVRIFLAAVERAFQIASLSVEHGIKLYEVQIEIFKAKQEQIRTQVIAYEAQIRGELSKVELFKALIDGELAKVNIDRARVELYQAQIEAIKTWIEKYEIEVRVEVSKLQAADLRIRAFGEQVNVYKAELESNKIRYDAFESRVRAELGKAQIVESESRAYVGQVQGISAGVTAEARALEAGVTAFGAEIEGFRAEVEAQRWKSATELSSIQAQVAGYEASTARYVADSGRFEALARIELAAWGAGLSNQLEYYRAQVAKYETDSRLLAEQARIALAGLDAAGGLATTIVGGALAAMHVGATISGNGGVTASGNLSENYSTSTSINSSVEGSESINQSIDYRINADAPDSIIATSPPWGAVDVA